MKKRITALLLCCVMLLTLCPGLISTATAYDDTQPDQAEATGEIVQPTVNFTDVAPFLPPVSGGVPMLRTASFAAPRAAANYAANDAANFAATDNGMKISKTATPNADGSYTITLEAYATGSKVITEQKTDIPTDIILVLDQSGSMADDIGTVTYKKYEDVEGYWETTYHTRNQDYYECRHNGGNENLYYFDVNSKAYYPVSVEVVQTATYTPLDSLKNYTTSWGQITDGCYWYYRDNLYEKVGEEYQKVSLTRDLILDGFLGLDSYYRYTYKFSNGDEIQSDRDNGEPDLGSHGPLYYSAVDTTKTVYTYTYTDANGETQTIGTSTGATTRPNYTFYQRSISTNGGGSRLQALKTAVTNFTNAVAKKAAGKDGDIATTGDNINHRIAVVGFASSGTQYNSNKYENTEVFVGAAQYKYGESAQSQYGNALQSMDTAAGKNNITSSIGALDAYGGTFTDLGMEMANGIFENNPIPDGQKRNRVIIVFTDGYPGTGDSVDDTVANDAVSQGYTAKQSTANDGYGATVYTVGIFSGADGTPVESFSGVSNPNKFMHLLSSNYKTAQSYSDSSKYGTATYPAGGGSYYLSAADADSLNSIFQQISDQIETGGSASTLTAESVVKDIISPQFTLPEGATAANITLETYKYQGPSFAADNAWVNNNDAMGAKATVNGDTVSVTGFDFAANYVGTVTENGNVSYRGNKLVISFKVQPKAGFLGGNDVYTNFSAGVYENGSATDPVLSFPQPQVNVPIDDVAVTAANKNVYLLGEVTADQLKDGTEISVGDVTLNLAADATNYGLEEWQTAYVNITVEVKDKGGNVITTDLTDLTDDTTYTVEVTVAPKTQGTSTPEKGEAATAKTGVNAPAANIYVFNPEVNFKDSTIYRGNTADYSNNQTDTPVWKHGNKVDTAVDMIGTAPTLTYTYGKDEGAFENCTDVNVTVKIGSTDVTDKTTGDKQFTVHVLQPTITATVNDVERYYGESYTLGDGANGAIDLTWTDNHNHSAIPPVTGTMPYNKTNLSLAYSATAFSGTVPARDFDVTVKVMKDDTVMPATITTTCTHGCSAAQTDGKYTVHVKTCTLTIKKSGCDTDKDANQSFIFDVTGPKTMQVTVQGDGSAKIVGLPVGDYTVTEDGDWSWRYTAQNTGKVTLDAANHTGTVTITNQRTDPDWLSGDNYAVNHVGGIKPRGTFVAGN